MNNINRKMNVIIEVNELMDEEAQKSVFIVQVNNSNVLFYDTLEHAIEIAEINQECLEDDGFDVAIRFHIGGNIIPTDVWYSDNDIFGEEQFITEDDMGIAYEAHRMGDYPHTSREEFEGFFERLTIDEVTQMSGKEKVGVINEIIRFKRMLS